MKIDNTKTRRKAIAVDSPPGYPPSRPPVRDKTNTSKNWLPRQRSSKDRKNNFRLFIYSHSSNIPACFVKIGPVCVEIGLHVINLTEIVRNKNKKLSYRRGTARCVMSIKILPIATLQCRNYLYDKS